MQAKPLDQFPELAMLRHILVSSHPSFGRVDEILIGLAADESVSPAVFDRVCEALFVVLNAYAEAINGD